MPLFHDFVPPPDYGPSPNLNLRRSPRRQKRDRLQFESGPSAFNPPEHLDVEPRDADSSESREFGIGGSQGHSEDSSSGNTSVTSNSESETSDFDDFEKPWKAGVECTFNVRGKEYINGPFAERSQVYEYACEIQRKVLCKKVQAGLPSGSHVAVYVCDKTAKFKDNEDQSACQCRIICRKQRSGEFAIIVRRILALVFWHLTKFFLMQVLGTGTSTPPLIGSIQSSVQVFLILQPRLWRRTSRMKC